MKNETISKPLSDGVIFLESIEKRDYQGARVQLRRLFHESALSKECPVAPFWGMAGKMSEHKLRSAIGITHEFIGHRTMRYTTIGAIKQIEGLFAADEDDGHEIFTDKERLRSRRLLMAYTLRHPRDILGTRLALEILTKYSPPKKLFNRTLKTYALGKVFAPIIRMDLGEYGIIRKHDA